MDVHYDRPLSFTESGQALPVVRVSIMDLTVVVQVKAKAGTTPGLGQALPVVRMFITQVTGFGVEDLDNKRA